MYLISDGGINVNPPDTLEAIMLTKSINHLDGVKLDVRQSLDKVLVLSKYNDLSKLTCSGYKVNEVNYAYIKKVKFPSHIFKYFVPTLEEILKRYDRKKIIALELYEKVDFNQLYNLLSKYNYTYFFISKDEEILGELENYHFNYLGKIINKESNILIINSVSHHDIYDNSILIIEK